MRGRGSHTRATSPVAVGAAHRLVVAELTYAERLEQFAATKTRDALAAVLPPYRTVLEAPTASMTAIGNAWSERLFDGRFFLSAIPDGVPAASLVFVQSSDGNTGTRNPASLGGGETDKHLVYEGLSRVTADAVMAGAETVRGGDTILSVWHPELVALRSALGKPRHPVQIIATLRGMELDRGMLFNLPEVPVVIITVRPFAVLMQRGLERRPWIASIVMDSSAHLRAAFEALQRQGIRRISVIGGRTVATQLIDAGLIQDLYLTTAARPGGEPDTPLYAHALLGRTVVRKRGTGVEEGITFEHLLLDR